MGVTVYICIPGGVQIETGAVSKFTGGIMSGNSLNVGVTGK